VISAGFTLLALAMWHIRRFDLTVDYRTSVWARAFQGLAFGLLFVPVSRIAYSALPTEKNTKAASLTNRFRDQGGSFGVTFGVTMLEHQSQSYTTGKAGGLKDVNRSKRLANLPPPEGGVTDRRC
jgi:DHA2 family multidrug resistance protein